MKAEIIVLLSLLSFSCTSTNKDHSHFKEYYSKIGIIETPISVTCGSFDKIDTTINNTKETTEFRTFRQPPKGLDLRIFNQYLPKNMDIINGRIFRDEDNIYIIYGATGDNIYLYLYCYNKNGQVIDSTELFNGICSADENMETRVHTFIDINKIITLIDTTKSYIIDTLDKINPRKHSGTMVSTRKLKIEDSGKITIIEEKSKNI